MTYIYYKYPYTEDLLQILRICNGPGRHKHMLSAVLRRGLPLFIARPGYLVMNMCRMKDKAPVRWELIGMPAERVTQLICIQQSSV
jgi:hypothetical protein